jgi:hypothetical protein
MVPKVDNQRGKAPNRPTTEVAAMNTPTRREPQMPNRPNPVGDA